MRQVGRSYGKVKVKRAKPGVDEVHEDLKSLVHDIETSVAFDADFGDIQFNDLD